MHTLRDLTAGAAFGAVMYGISHLNMLTPEDYQQYNTSVVECGTYLGGEGREAAEVPPPCDQFVYIYQPIDGQPFVDPNGKPVYFLPSYDEFMSDFPLISPTEEASREAHDERDADIQGVAFGSMLFIALRLIERVGKKDRDKKNVPGLAAALRKGSDWQPNEDAPDYPRAFPNIP